MIGYDLDGVICDCWPNIRFRVMRDHGIDLKYVQKGYDIVIPGLDRQQIKDYVANVIEMEHQKILPYSGCYKVLRKRFDQDKTIVVVTARNERLKGLTRIWLINHFPHIDFAVFHCRSTEKPKLCKSLGIDTFVEDHHQTAQAMVDSGIKTYLVDRQWNQNEVVPGAIRIKHIRDIQ